MNKLYKLYKIINGFSNEVNENHVSAYASSAAFFIFISMIPCIMLLLSMIPYTPVSKADILKLTVGILPDSMDGVAINVIDELYGQSMTFISATAVATMWSAAKGMLAITRGLNTIYEVNETRNYFVLRIRAAFYTVGMIAMLVVCLVVMVFGNSLNDFLLRSIPYLSKISEVIVNFKFILTLTILTFIFVILYKLIPNRKASILSQVPGAVFTAVIWVSFSFFFSVYIDYFHGFSMYGSLTTVIITLLWLYICMTILFLGAQINAYFEPAFQYLHGKYKQRRRNKKAEK